jgi:four helix bundle protein
MSREELTSKSEQLVAKMMKLCGSSKGEISTRLLNSTLKVGEGIAVSANAYSKQNFVEILSRTLEACGVAEFWLKMLYTNKGIKEKNYEPLKAEIKELVRLLVGNINANRG